MWEHTGLAFMITTKHLKMTDSRFDKLCNWLEVFFADANFVITQASDDASFRRYFRVERNNSSFIIMDAPPDKEDSKPFVAIGKYLRRHAIHTPKIIESDLEKGFLLLEDLGNQTFLKAQQTNLNLEHYKKAIDILLELHTLDIKSSLVPKYNQTLLNNEMRLLVDWYLPQTNIEQQTQLNKLFNLLCANALNTSQVFVHRDYHSRNLMLLDDCSLAVIDFQDAVIGSHLYDLVSLLKDAYFELSSESINELLNYFYQQSNITTGFKSFEKQFDLMGLQRHLKILGIFKRLSIRDGKDQYLQDIPLVRKYALQTADKYSEFAFLKEIL